MTIDAARLDALLHPTFARDADYEVLAEGVARLARRREGRDRVQRRGRRGGGRGRARRDPRAPVHRGGRRGRLPRGARGSSRAEGGKASHAALVARGMGTPCVAGAGALEIDLTPGGARGGTVLREGDLIAIDGTTGIVTADDVPLVDPEVGERLRDGARLGGRAPQRSACAPTRTPRRTRARRASSAPRASASAAREHMFMATDRQPKMQAMIMAESEEERARGARRPAAAPAGALRGPVRGDAGAAGDHPPARPAAPRVPP